MATGSWRHLWGMVNNGEDCGGLIYAAFLKLWVSAFGASERALRLPSVLAVTASVAVLLWIGHALWGRRAALYVGLCAAAHPETIHWSRQARAYGFELFATALCLAAVLLYRGPGGRNLAPLLICASCLLVLTHGFGAFVVVGMALFLWTSRPSLGVGNVSGCPTLWHLAPALALAALTAFQLRHRARLVLQDYWITGSLAENYGKVLRFAAPPAGTTAVLIAAGLLLLARDRSNPSKRRVAWALTVLTAAVLSGPLAVSLLASGRHNFVLDRYFMPLIPIFILPTGYLFSRLPTLLGASAALALCVISFVAGRAPDLYTDWGDDFTRTRAAVAFLREQVQDGEALVVCPWYQQRTLNYYGLRRPLKTTLWTRENLRSELDTMSRSGRPGRVWVVVDWTLSDDDLRAIGMGAVMRYEFGTLRVLQFESAKAALGEGMDAGPP